MSEKPTYEELSIRLDVLQSISSLTETDVKTVADHVLISIVRITGSAYGFFGFINEDESVMTIHAWSGEAMKDCSMVDTPTHFSISEAGLWGEVIRRREPLILNDYDAPHPGKKGLPQGHVQLTNLLIVPFMTQGRITSVSAVANRVADYTQDDVTQLTAFLNSIQAIIDGKRAEEALRESEEFSSSLLESSPNPILVVNPDISIRYVNPVFEELTGYDSKEILGEKAPFPWWVDDPRSGNIQGRKARIFKEERGRELLFRKKNGELFWVEISNTPINRNGEIIYILTSWVDITKRKRVEEALRESEEKYRGLFDESIAAVYLFDEKKNFLDSNQAGLDLLGYSREELLNMSIPDVDANPIVVLPAHEQLLSGDRIINYEHKLKRKDGKIITVLNNSRPLINDDEQVVGMQSTLINITERKKTEEALQKLHNDLERRIEERTSELAKTNLDLQAKIIEHKKAEEALLESEKELETKTINLEEVNAALKVLLKRREEDKKELEETVLS
ncbi:MAG: PAS domain S-box protein, partial [Deltaproteobacteria bacterium]|nr:PAS domain S-box protein [Deltaproteobacteria bacterium]